MKRWGLLFISCIVTTLSACQSTPQPSPNLGATVQARATGTILRNAKALYPRAIRLNNSGAANGRVLASVTDASGNPEAGLGLIFESTNNGSSFHQVGTITDPNATGGKGLCCSTLFELPQQIGAMPADTLLRAGSIGGLVSTDRHMTIRIWKSNDLGRTWTYLSNCATSSNAGGIWEPEFSIAADGRLVCHYSDETDSLYSQKLARVRSSDGIDWVDRSDTIASTLQSDRPGMAVVRKLPNGSHLMTYEICAAAGQFTCVVHYRTSADGWNWGSVTDLGTRPETVDGKYFKHAPTIAWSSFGPNGRILMVGQILYNKDGTVASGNGKTILVSAENTDGFWYEVSAPVQVNNPDDNYCPNYSSSLLPSLDGRSLLEIANDYDGTVCKPYYASASILGTGTASGVVNNTTNRLVNVMSGQCLDVSADSRVAGGNVQQWNCNGLGAQNWLLTDRGNGYFALRGQNSGLCLDVSADSRVAGGNVQQWTCNGLEPQDWHLENVGIGYYRLVGRNSGLCLEATGGSKTAGANVQQWYCNDHSTQIWRLEGR